MKQPLTQIRAINLKGQPIDVTFTPLTAIIGPNAGGKTAVAAAVAIALLGHLPSLGKTATATAKLMKPGAKLLDVQAILATGERINRRLERKGAKLQTSLDGPDYSDTINPVQLDFSQFAKAKPTDRQRILEGMMVATADADVLEDARDRIAKSGQEFATELGSDGWLQALEAEAKESHRLTKQDLDTAAKTILQLSGEEKPEGFDADYAAKVESELAEKRVELGRAGEKLDAIAELHQEAPDRPEGVEPTEGEISLNENELAKIQAEIQELRDRRTAFRNAKERAEEIMRPHSGIEPVEAKAAPMTGEELVAMGRRLEDQKRELNTAITRAKTNLEHAEKRKQETRDSIEKLEGMTCCPTCGTDGETFKQSFTDKLSVELSERDQDCEKAHEALESLEAGVDALVEAEDAYKAKVKEREQHAAFLAQVRAEEAMAGVNNPTNEEVQEKLDREAFLKSHVSTAKLYARAWIEYRAAKVPTEEETSAATEKHAALKEEVRVLVETQERLKTAGEALASWRGNQSKLAELNTDNEKRETTMKALKELAQWSKVKSLELTAAAMRPLLEVCNRIMDGLVEGSIAIEGTEVGVMRDDHFIGLEVLSGSEAAAVASSIQIAIAAGSPIPLVMIDELSSFAVARKVRFLTNLAEAITEGKIGQVIVLDHDPVTGETAEQLAGGSVVHVKES